MTSSCVTRRARPLLGTFVEIRAVGGAAAFDLAFAAIAKAQRLMSSHDPESDVARINRARAGETLRVHPWTWRVLARAREIFEATAGLFDCNVARHLQRAGFLPRQARAARPDRRATIADLELLEGVVRPCRALGITLDGIAKGFAVDQAVRALRRAGATAGAVNAGGDLRLFGDRSEPVFVRHPDCPGRLVRLGEFRDVAVATSALYFAREGRAGNATSPIVDPASGSFCLSRSSATVIAADCMTADALTKPALLNPRGVASALRALGARAIVIPATRAA